MPSDEHQHETAPATSGESVRIPITEHVVQRNEFRLVLSFAALIVTIMVGGAAFFFAELMDMNTRLLGAIDSRLDVDDRMEIIRRIEDIEELIGNGIDELNLDTEELKSGNETVNDRLLRIETQVELLLQTGE